jgi:hypothetical protein
MFVSAAPEPDLATMTDQPTSPDTQFTDDDVKAILRRAAEIDKTGALTETDLREIAKEASISQNAVNRALAEMQLQRREAVTEEATADDIMRAHGGSAIRIRIGSKAILWIAAAAVLAMMFLARLTP